jgi:peptide/nickel transport system permease protein
MAQYIIKRILIFLPTLWVISLLSFGLSKLAPGDPVNCDDELGSPLNSAKACQEKAAQLGLDKPIFYCGLTSTAFPDTLHYFVQREIRKNLSNLIHQYGNWPKIEHYYNRIVAVDQQLAILSKAGHKEQIRNIRPKLKQLYISDQDERISSLIDDMETKAIADSLLNANLLNDVVSLRTAYQEVVENPTRFLLYIPDIKWYGWDNQYHNWISNFIQFDFGISYYDGRPVSSRMKDALVWTIIINLLAIFFAYLLSIPIGVYTAIFKNTFFDRLTTLLLFILYSLPSFWIATILVVFFTTPEYGMNWFPSLGTGDLPDEAPFWDRFRETATHLILPVFCLTYGALAFISRQVRGGMLSIIRQDYIRTAWAKGLGSTVVIWKHTFRNALFPVITMFASILPSVFAGSLVIEVIFNIPGMGKLTVDAIFQRDWPVVYTVLMLSATLTMTGILLADLLYAWVDPRVSYNIKKK